MTNISEGIESYGGISSLYYRAKVDSQNRVVQIHRWENDLSLTALFNLGEASFPIDHQGKQIFNSEWEAYGGKETGERESRFLGKGQMVILENQSTP
jgi:hypothetical protein